ncbi:MAG: phospholipase A [Arcobacteraceae bacterium]
MSFLFKALIFCVFVISANSQENQSKLTHENQLISDISTTLNSSASDSEKLENIKQQLLNKQQTQNDQNSKYHFNLMTHHENFLLFGGHSSSNLTQKHWDANGNRDYNNEYTRDTNEAQFQISFKIPLVENIFNDQTDLFVAYTQNSFWQVYDDEHSSPFRETNYMPEIFLQWQPDMKISTSILKEIQLSLIHQSNGQSIGASRSWNRAQVNMLLQRQNLFYGVELWERFKENQKSSPSEARGDDNPNLEHYIGKQKYFIKYEADQYKITLAHQNDLFNYSTSRGNTKLDFVFPSMNSHFDFFIRYFHGYGESLIDYDVKINRISFGIILANWN